MSSKLRSRAKVVGALQVAHAGVRDDTDKDSAVGSDSSLRSGGRAQRDAAPAERRGMSALYEQLSAHAPALLRGALTVLAAWMLWNYFHADSESRRLRELNEQLVAHIKLQKLDVPRELVAPRDSGSVGGVEVVAFGIVVLCLAGQMTRFLLREWRQYDKMRRRVMADHLEQLRQARRKKLPLPPDKLDQLLSQFIWYRLDYWFSLWPLSKAAVLLSLTLTVIVLGGVVFFAVQGETLGAAFWASWVFVVDSGAHADEKETGERIVALVLTAAGMLVFAMFIGLVSDSISQQFENLRQGTAKVVEMDHCVVCGWSDKTVPLLRELATANQSAVADGTGSGAIVILADAMEKQQMEEEVEAAGLDLKGSTVVCRKGNPTLMHDLRHVNVNAARSIIVCAPPRCTADEADAKSLRTVLALVGMKYDRGHVTVEICDIDNRRLVHIVGGERVETVVAHDFIGRLIVQASRQPGLAMILSKLLGFDGDEFYLKQWPALVGKTFGELCFLFADAVVLGVKTAPHGGATHGRVRLNPPDSYELQKGDELVVLAEDDDKYEPADHMHIAYQPPEASTATPSMSSLARDRAPGAENVLIIGWRRDLGDLIREIDDAVGPGSELTLFDSTPIEEREERFKQGGRAAPGEHGFRLKNIRAPIQHRCGDPCSRRELQKELNSGAQALERFRSIFILAPEELEGDMEQSDGRAITALLLIYDIRYERIQRAAARQRGDPPHGDARSTSSTSAASAAASALSAPPWSPRYDASEGLNLARISSLDTTSGAHGPPPVVVAEILDPGTRQLVHLAKLNNYVMSNEMVSAALAMVSESRDVNAILAEILSSEGSEIYVRSAGDYLSALPRQLSFWEVMVQVRLQKGVLLGYIPASDGADAEEAAREQTDETGGGDDECCEEVSGGPQPRLNPRDKSQRREWRDADRLVLISEF